VTLFDAYVLVDWSASDKPKTGKDSIWIGVATRRGGEVVVGSPENPPTRAEAEARVKARLRDLVAERCRVLAGFDFPYGYPRGFAAALDSTTDSAPWRATWRRLSEVIRDDDHNASNRFEAASALNAKLGVGPGPFWGCPPGRETETLGSTACQFPYAGSAGTRIGRRRATECRLRGVQETWKLFGRGSVGSQALVGIPRIAALRNDTELAAHSRVWPFETGFREHSKADSGPFVLHAEIWPGIVAIDASQHEIRDAAQVSTLARHFARLDDRNELATMFRTPALLDPSAVAACIAEEGWILGA
jgi:hypothetical protein